jgi:hypothetical protein
MKCRNKVWWLGENQWSGQITNKWEDGWTQQLSIVGKEKNNSHLCFTNAPCSKTRCMQQQGARQVNHWNTMNNETSWLETKNIESVCSQQKCWKQTPSSSPNAPMQLSQNCATFHQCIWYGAKEKNKNKNNVQACKGSCKVLETFMFLLFSGFYARHAPLKKIYSS